MFCLLSSRPPLPPCLPMAGLSGHLLGAEWQRVSRMFPESLHSQPLPGLPEGTAGPERPLAPLRGSSCYHSGTKGFYTLCGQEGQRQRGWRGPQQNSLPPSLRAVPRGTARQAWSIAKHRTSQLPPRAPTACQSGGARSQEEGRQPPVTTLANCQSQRPRSPSGNSGLPIKAWPAVTLKGPAARQEVHRRPF